MGFLDACGAFGRYAKMQIVVAEQFADFPATFAGQGDDVHAEFVGGADRLDDVGRIARSGDGEQDIAGMAERTDLAGKNLGEAVVIADSGQDGTVGRQGDGCQLLAFGLETADQLGGKVLGIGSRAAIAAGQDLAAIEQGAGQHFDGGGDRCGHRFNAVELGTGTVFEMLRDAGDQIHAVKSRNDAGGHSTSGGRGPRFAAGSKIAREGIVQPLDAFPFEQDAIEAARAFAVAGEVMAGGEQDALLLLARDAGGCAAEGRIFALPHFNEDEAVAMLHDEIEFATTDAKITGQ